MSPKKIKTKTKTDMKWCLALISSSFVNKPSQKIPQVPRINQQVLRTICEGSFGWKNHQQRYSSFLNIISQKVSIDKISGNNPLTGPDNLRNDVLTGHRLEERVAINQELSIILCKKFCLLVSENRVSFCQKNIVAKHFAKRLRKITTIVICISIMSHQLRPGDTVTRSSFAIHQFLCTS